MSLSEISVSGQQVGILVNSSDDDVIAVVEVALPANAPNAHVRLWTTGEGFDRASTLDERVVVSVAQGACLYADYPHGGRAATVRLLGVSR